MADDNNETQLEEEFFYWDDLVRLAEKEKEDDEILVRELEEREERRAILNEIRKTKKSAAKDLNEALHEDGEVQDEIEIKMEAIYDPNE